MEKRSVDGRLEILFEDEQLVGLVKPAGLPTANAERGQESVYTILRRCSTGTRRSPQATGFLGIVSRLDAPVSGAVVVAKTPAAAASLAAQFRDRAVEKHYVAVVAGRFPGPVGVWQDWHDVLWRPVGEARTRLLTQAGSQAHGARGEHAASPPAGEARQVHVRARVVKRAGEVSLVELAPTTGRRHQLRAQLAGRGCPIVGDRLYGSRLPFPGSGIALHAWSLVFAHPVDGRRVALQAPVPDAWKSRFPALVR